MISLGLDPDEFHQPIAGTVFLTVLLLRYYQDLVVVAISSDPLATLRFKVCGFSVSVTAQLRNLFFFFF